MPMLLKVIFTFNAWRNNSMVAPPIEICRLALSRFPAVHLIDHRSSFPGFTNPAFQIRTMWKGICHTMKQTCGKSKKVCGFQVPLSKLTLNTKACLPKILKSCEVYT